MLFFAKLDERAFIPTKATPGAAAFDLHAPDGGLVAADGMTEVPLALACAIPTGFVGLVSIRSGLARKQRLGIQNAPGIIDADYRGPLILLLTNQGPVSYSWERGERLAQLTVVPVFGGPVRAVAEGELSVTQRGTGGFGSTGR